MSNLPPMIAGAPPANIPDMGRHGICASAGSALVMVVGACVGGIDGQGMEPPRGSAGQPAPGPGRPTPTPMPMPAPMPGPGAGPPANGTDPGRVALRRLTRREYNATVRDLMGTRLRPADAFEPDRSGLGFDNNGDVQTLSPLQVEQYQAAAEALVDEALAAGPARLAEIARTASCQPTEATCLSQLTTRFARRAWRRPPTPAEVSRLVALAAAARARGDDALAQLGSAWVAVLSSPHFLFKVELDPDPRSPMPRALDDHEIATRLSYLIYGSLPDDALFTAADQGQLRTPEQVSAQASRMMTQPRAMALATGFAEQWLDLRALEHHEIDPAVFGASYDRALGALMTAETARFFWEFVSTDRPVAEMLTARFTFLDARLARHYGLTSPGGTGGLTRVELTGAERGGLLTQGAILTTTSPPNHTSPVARGAWLLSTLLCSPPPPPPANIPPLPEPSPTTPTSLRARLEAHRMNPLCASCHQLMDPLGFALEHYDGIGRWRTNDGQVAIDASGMLPDGSRFDGAIELGALLAKDPRVPACMTAKLYTYALGRVADGGTPDHPYLERILWQAKGSSGITVKQAIAALVTSDPFRMRRAAPAGGSP